MAVHIFISWNLYTLRDREVDLYCHLGTHEFVYFHILLVYIQYVDILLYFNANTEHGKKNPHSKVEKDQTNQTANWKRSKESNLANDLLDSGQLSFAKQLEDTNCSCNKSIERKSDQLCNVSG